MLSSNHRAVTSPPPHFSLCRPYLTTHHHTNKRLSQTIIKCVQEMYLTFFLSRTIKRFRTQSHYEKIKQLEQTKMADGIIVICRKQNKCLTATNRMRPKRIKCDQLEGVYRLLSSTRLKASDKVLRRRGSVLTLESLRY